jgi:hypothetical protein
LRENLIGTKKNKEYLLVSIKAVGQRVKDESTKHKIMSGEQHAGKNHNIKTGNKSFKYSANYKYFETILKN